jgi:hypothetical protein
LRGHGPSQEGRDVAEKWRRTWNKGVTD